MRSNTPMTLDQIQANCPAVFQDTAHPERSDQYVHISTLPVLQAMNDAGYGVSRAQQTNSRSAQAQGYARHLLAFRPLKTFGKTAVGDAIPEVLLINSHDGNSAYKLHAGLFRLVCENGLVVGNTFKSVNIRHRGEAAMEVVENTQEIFDVFVPQLADWVERAQGLELSARKQNSFAEKAMSIRFGKVHPFPAKELLTVTREEDEGPSLWAVYNRVQEAVMRGGIQYENVNGRQCEVRPINRVTKDVMYNQRLWDAATEVLEAA